MKFVFTIILLFSFIGLAVLGVFSMNHNIEHNRDGCIAAMANGQACPQNGNALQFLTFHLNAFKSFSTTTIGDNLVNALLLLFALILAIGFRIIANIQLALPALAISYHRRRFLESYSFPYQQKLTGWLALHENSPASS